MAEVVKLKDRGPKVIQHIDLYDEGQYGAGEVAFRDRYYSLADVKTAIEEVLKVSPIEDPKDPMNPLSFRRFFCPNKWGFRHHYPDDPYAYKSRWLVHFLLSFNFHNDFCYIDLGLDWEPFIKNGKKNPDYPLGNYALGQIFSLSDLHILRICGITLQDALILTDSLGMSAPIGIDPDGEITPDQLAALDVDGDVLMVDQNRMSYILIDSKENILISKKV